MAEMRVTDAELAGIVEDLAKARREQDEPTAKAKENQAKTQTEAIARAKRENARVWLRTVNRVLTAVVVLAVFGVLLYGRPWDSGGPPIQRAFGAGIPVAAAVFFALGLIQRGHG